MTLSAIWSKLSSKTKLIVVFCFIVIFGSIISISVIGYYKNKAFEAQQETVESFKAFIEEKESKESEALEDAKTSVSKSTNRTNNIIKKQKDDEATINNKSITNDDINELITRFKNGSD